jgi:hypothetical protein
MALACLTLASALVLVLSGPAGARHEDSLAAHAASASHLQVSELEYRLGLSRGVVKAGTLDLEQLDVGSDPHDLRLRRIGSSATIYGRLLTPGKRWDGVVYLKPGVYRLWCSLPEHEKLGMHATLRVVR